MCKVDKCLYCKIHVYVYPKNRNMDKHIILPTWILSWFTLLNFWVLRCRNCNLAHISAYYMFDISPTTKLWLYLHPIDFVDVRRAIPQVCYKLLQTCSAVSKIQLHIYRYATPQATYINTSCWMTISVYWFKSNGWQFHDVIKWKHFLIYWHLCGEFTDHRNFDVFFDLCLNKRLSKHWWGWWFEKPSCPLWRPLINVVNSWTQFDFRLFALTIKPNVLAVAHAVCSENCMRWQFIIFEGQVMILFLILLIV